MSNSHARRFVRSAWTLLSFQLVASVGAVAVTGLAAFHVQRMAADLEAARSGVATEAVATPDTARVDPRIAPGIPTTTEQPPADPARIQEGSTEAPADAAAAPSAAANSANVAICQRVGPHIRIQANAPLCDTDVAVRRGQTITIQADGRWGPGRAAVFGPAGTDRRSDAAMSNEAPVGALIGRVGEHVFPVGAGGAIEIRTNGSLHLGINDDPNEISDNQGYVDVFLQVPGER